jgi:integrase
MASGIPPKWASLEITAFLTHLATRCNMSASTQNQALAALLFLYRNVLGQELDFLQGVVRARSPMRLPVFLSRGEVAAILGRLRGTVWIMASLMYGSGLRLLESARLRVKDVDFSRREITVRDGKGQRDRVTLIPARLVRPLTEQLRRARLQHVSDVQRGAGYVELPHALARKYPNAAREWAWQWIFPATRIYVDRETGHRTFMNPPSSARSRRPFAPPGSRSRRAAIACATPSPPISWRTATTSPPSRNGSDTKT